MDRKPVEDSSDRGIDRRSFLKLSGSGVAISLLHLQGAFSSAFASQIASGDRVIDYQSTDDLYRSLWSWDSVTWGSHTNQCAPGGCSFRVYSKNGVIWREEQSARSYASNSDYPDYNPQGCQKGCGFHNSLTTPERVKYPLKRVGERGAGRYLRASEVFGGREDQLFFYDELADSIIEAPRGTLTYEGKQALDGTYPVQLADGSIVEVTPGFALLKEKLNNEYTPGKASKSCGVHPDVIRQMAGKVATKRTCSYIGFTLAKHYHGDLMLASVLLHRWINPLTRYLPVFQMDRLLLICCAKSLMILT